MSLPTYTRCPYPLAVQSLIFSKNEFDLPEAMEWMADNKVRRRPLELLETGQSWRARMYEPSDFMVGSFRTIRLGRGQSRVQAVVGCPKKHVREAIISGRAERQTERTQARPSKKAQARAAQRSPRPTGDAAVIAELARRLGVKPPSRQMTLAEYARRQGIDVRDDRPAPPRRRRSRKARRR